VLTPALTQCCLHGARKPAKPLLNNLLTHPAPSGMTVPPQVWRLIGCSPAKLSGSARTIRPGLLAMLDYALNRRPRRYCRRLPRSTASAGSSRSDAELGDRRITLWGLNK